MNAIRFFPPRSGSLFALLCAGLLVSGCASPAHAENEPGHDIVDPPARVGSISALRGPVDTSTEAGGAWEPAQINQPVTSQTALWAPPGSQAEVRIGSSSVRLDGNTQAVFSQIDDHGVSIDVAQGTVRARVRNLPTGDRFSLSADGVRAEADGPGDYRVEYDPDRRAYTLRALAGRLRLVTPNNSFTLGTGQEALVERGGETLQLRAMGQRDDFDQWAEARDRDQDRLAAARYVSPETTGIEALDEHGRWDTVTEYGAVWYPRALPYGWAPYRYGRWAYVRPWGWTWVDDAPWGFAPFHYGRWALIGSAWGWVPGPIVTRPVWAPALVGYVGYVGGGGGVSIGIGGGRPVGWFPLGPREVYHPPYRYSPRYARQVNIINVTNVVNVAPSGDRAVTRPQPPVPAYRYAQRPEAVTIVREDQFRNARRIGRDRIELSAQQAAQLQPVVASVGGRPAAAGPAPGGLPTAALPPAPPQRDARADEPRRGFRDPRVERPRFEAERPRAVGPFVDAQPGTQPQPPAGVPMLPRGPDRHGGGAVQPTSPAVVESPRGQEPDRMMRRHDDERGDWRHNGRAAENRGEPQWRGDRPQPRQTPEPARVPTPAPQLALPQVTPAPQLIPRPVPVPQVMPSPQVMSRPVPVPGPQQGAMPPQPRTPERYERQQDRSEQRRPPGDGPGQGQGPAAGKRERER